MLEFAQNNAVSGMIFANPNAPTSLALSTDEIRSMLLVYPKEKVFVVDEAYVDFSDETALSLLSEFQNLVIIRTFSKSFSFAGMRLGYAVANPNLIEALTRVKNSFNHFPVDCITQEAGIASCENVGYYKETAMRIKNTRQFCVEKMRELGWFCFSSKTNFILAKKEGYAGKDLYEKIKSKGFLVRHFASPLVQDYVRITVGSEKEMAVFRRRNIGVIYQSFNLIPNITVEKNILLPLMLDQRKPAPTFFEEIIQTLGIGDKLKRFPTQLSGGEQQRVAIARSLVTRPAIILADEPTGNLDRRNTEEITSLFRLVNQRFQATILLVTHDEKVALSCERVMFMVDGTLHERKDLR